MIAIQNQLTTLNLMDSRNFIVYGPVKPISGACLTVSVDWHQKPSLIQKNSFYPSILSGLSKLSQWKWKNSSYIMTIPLKKIFFYSMFL